MQQLALGSIPLFLYSYYWPWFIVIIIAAFCVPLFAAFSPSSAGWNGLGAWVWV